jgi:hypothetical protein
MSKKSDDSIERIFRQALTHYDTTFRESDWLKMEKMLDDDAMRMAVIRSKRIKGIGFALTGLTVLFIAVYFLAFNPSDSTAKLDHPATETQAGDDLTNNGNVENENSSNGLLSSADSARSDASERNEKFGQTEVTPSREKTSKNLSTERDKGNGLKSTSENIQKSGPHTNDDKSKGTITKPSRIPQESITPGAANKKDIVNLQDQVSVLKNAQDASNEKPVVEDNQLLIKGENKNGNRADQNENEQELNVVGQDNPQITAKEKSPLESNNQIGRNESPNTLGENAIRGQAGDSIQQNQSRNEGMQQPATSDRGNLESFDATKDSTSTIALAKKPEDSDSIHDPSPNKPKKSKAKPVSRWSIGVVFTPEFSTTRLTHYSTPGESVGLRVGYQISNRLQINTGIIRSNKRYKDLGSEYSPNPNYWNARTNGVIPEEIDGKCLVYEIPLGVQFDVVSREKSRVFVSAAMSNYIMVSQVYQYSFDDPNPGADMSWQTSRTDKYWFGVGVISAGYERYLSRSIALGIEPYLKTSLTEIGWPNVKLFSTGAYITLRYRFITKEIQPTK